MNTLATIMPTGESCPITWEAVGVKYCREELKRMKFPNRPPVAIASNTSQRRWRKIRIGGSFPLIARIAPRPIAAIKKR